MNRIWVHRYALVPRRRLSGISREGAREGALLRIGDGYADLHPWPELGDRSLDEQLALLSRGELTSQLRASFRLAEADADARRRGVSLFDGLEIPLSHWPGPDPPDGFDTVKTKGAASLPPDVRLRIDFNGSLSPDQFLAVAAALPKERVDFVEDPCPFDAETWRRVRAATGLRLAYDREPAGSSRLPAGQRPATVFDVLVHKPALHPDWPQHDDVVVTSYMDHPVGQFGAAWVAAAHRTNPRCGLMTHVLYEPDAFVERVQRDGARLLPPAGSGIGFDDLLERIPWKSIG